MTWRKPIAFNTACLNSCRALLRLELLLFVFAVLTAPQDSFAQASRCETVLATATNDGKITDILSLGKEMTQGLILRPEQGDIFEIYRQIFFGDPKTSVDGKTLKDRKSTRLNSSHTDISRMPSSA